MTVSEIKIFLKYHIYASYYSNNFKILARHFINTTLLYKLLCLIFYSPEKGILDFILATLRVFFTLAVLEVRCMVV